MSIEHIKRIMSQRGVMLVFEFIKNQKEEPNFSQIKKGLIGQVSQEPIYASLDILLEEKLIEESYTRHPTEHIFSISEKGKEFLRKLEDLELFLKSPFPKKA